jgi:hypothetical protein
MWADSDGGTALGLVSSSRKGRRRIWYQKALFILIFFNSFWCSGPSLPSSDVFSLFRALPTL